MYMLLTYLIPLAVTAVVALISDYFLLPVWSLFNPYFYLYLMFLTGVFLVVYSFMCRLKKTNRVMGSVIGAGAIALCLVVLVFGWLSSWKLFHAKTYAAIMGDNLVETDITNLVISLEEASILDKDTAEQLALQEMGSLTDLVSQFDVQTSTQITYNGTPTRVMPLDYAGLIQCIMNSKMGIPAYITVDMRSQGAEIHYLEQTIKYTPKSILGNDLMRHIHYAYPTAILSGEPQFEIDDSGNPYYVVSVVKPQISLFGGQDVCAVITVDPCTGEIARYPIDSIPEWIDRVYPAEMVIEQYENYGKLKDGFWNSVLGQNGVVSTTDGYNYVSDSNDTYVYTGVTSVTSDESNIGFLFCNLRTKEARYYPLAGAEEFSAMTTAEEAVKNYGYQASFPLMLIIEGTPTYAMSLKGNGGLAYMYAMVNVNKYYLVATGQTLEECQKNYRNLILSNDVTITHPGTGSTSSGLPAGTVTGRILDIRTGVKSGTTYFYLRLEGNAAWYIISLLDNDEVIKLNPTDTVTLNVEASGDTTGPMIQAKLVNYTEGAPWWES